MEVTEVEAIYEPAEGEQQQHEFIYADSNTGKRHRLSQVYNSRSGRPLQYGGSTLEKEISSVSHVIVRSVSLCCARLNCTNSST